MRISVAQLARSASSCSCEWPICHVGRHTHRTDMFAPFKPSASAYSSIQVETGIGQADGHQLVAMLLDGAMGAIASAVSALERGDIAAKCKAVSKAAGIIDEGLRGALN